MDLERQVRRLKISYTKEKLGSWYWLENREGVLPQPAFTCLNLTIKALEQSVKYVQS